ncbi:hypothetical protein NW759_016371 [Fusarium solani]|nr:hypothetical protein NW759_016371 [Fusarium solani]
MLTLDVWEEIPAWDEVWRLKRAFDKRKADWHPTIKLYTIIICEILPDMVTKRHKLKEPPPEGKALNDTPEWYQTKFSSYQERQAEREQSHEFMLRTKAVRQCELHDIRDQSNSGLPITHHIYHNSWRLAMWNAKVDSVLPSYQREQIVAAIPTKWLPQWIPAETSSTKPAKRPAEWMPPDFTFSTKRAKRPAEWMSPDFTSSAKRAKNAEKLAGLGNRH